VKSFHRSIVPLKSGISFFVAVDETENGPDREQENETPIDAASPLSSVSIYIILLLIFLELRRNTSCICFNNPKKIEIRKFH